MVSSSSLRLSESNDLSNHERGSSDAFILRHAQDERVVYGLLFIGCGAAIKWHVRL